MKTWKHCTIFGFLAIFAFASISCDDGNGKTVPTPDLREAFFGTWIADNDNDFIVEISANVYIEDVNSSYYVPYMKMNNLVWTATTNGYEATKNDYPSGYTLSGIWSDDSDPSWKTVTTPTFSLFINATKDKISYGFGNPLTKKP